MRIAFFTEGLGLPASRFRVEQFVPHFERAGVRCSVRGAYGRGYHTAVGRPWAPAYKLGTRLVMAGRIATAGDVQADVGFFQRTALPFSAWPERALAARIPCVLDYDDAIFLDPHNGRDGGVRRRTFDDTVGSCQSVVAGNPWLAAQSRAPSKTVVIPTVLDTDRYRPAAPREGAPFVVGWMGSHTNLPGARSVFDEILACLEQLPGARLRIVSNATEPSLVGHPLVEHRLWSAATEVLDLQSFDVGLMPLPDNDISRGKCGFKMIQYMASGVPVLASAVGANVDVYGDSEAGALVAPGARWGPALLALARDGERRRRAREGGRRRAVEAYSLAVAVNAYLRIFDELKRRARPGA